MGNGLTNSERRRSIHRAALTLSADDELLERAHRALLQFLDSAASEPSLTRLRAQASAQLAQATWNTPDRVESDRLVDIARSGGADRRRRCAFADRDGDWVARALGPAPRGCPGPLHAFGRARASGARSHVRDDRPRRAAMTMMLSGSFGRARTTLTRIREQQYAMRFWSELSFTESLAAALDLLSGDALSAVARARPASVLRAIGLSVRAGSHFSDPRCGAARTGRQHWRGSRRSKSGGEHGPAVRQSSRLRSWPMAAGVSKRSSDCTTCRCE